MTQAFEEYLSKLEPGMAGILRHEIAIARADERAKTIEACIRAVCPMCRGETLYATGVVRIKAFPYWYHRQADCPEAWSCKCFSTELHDLKAREGDG